MTRAANADIEPVLAGPILRRTTPDCLCLWLAARVGADARVELLLPGGHSREFERTPGDPGFRHIRAGEHLHYLMLELDFDPPLPLDTWIGYRLSLRLHDEPGSDWRSDAEWAPELCYPGRDTPGFVLRTRVHSMLHGSCRKPHHDSRDGLVGADRWLAGELARTPGTDAVPDAWPSALVMSGDQVYADDVAGPMLVAIHRLIARLGLPDESMGALGLAGVDDARSLYEHEHTYYRREQLLTREEQGNPVYEVLFGGVRKPVFTTDAAHNHLMTVAEVLCMYLLVWSPVPWRHVEMALPAGLTDTERGRFADERRVLDEFAAGLAAVRRLFAHLPVAMIFDDHDVSDDWNLNRAWEERAYGNPLSRRVIGNALLGYCLNQGWGNRPEAFPAELLDALAAALAEPGSPCHDEAMDSLLRFEGWNYTWPTQPPLIVLDTRTRRWRSESSANRPSGLLDWEAVTDLQRDLQEHDSVLLVSAAPIFGVKLIELIQRVFTYVGKPLLVDAENWMAHPGTGGAILNVFRHRRTPKTFVILSGDVHYSFVYDVELRGRAGGPDIWQICSSGLRNTFPERLLNVLDHLNRWLYSPRSPLNLFTRRRRMKVVPRKPEGTPHGRRLLNRSGIGLVVLDAEGAPVRIRQLLADGGGVDFERRENESHWS